MARHIPPEVAADLRAETSPHALLGFLTIRHPALSAPIRLVSDPMPFEVDGEIYLACPFEFQLLSDEDAPPTTQLRVQNVDRRIGAALRALPDRAQIALEARSTADFDLSVVPRAPLAAVAPIYAFRHFDLIDVTVTAMDVTGTVMLRDYSQEAYPGKRATQSRCPGLFR